MYKHYIIGDVHGDYTALMSVLKHERIQYDPAHAELCFLGDLIDRNRDSREVLQFIEDIRAQGHRVTVLRGNHEDLILMALDEGLTSPLIDWIDGSWGGRKTLWSYRIDPIRISTYGDMLQFDGKVILTKGDIRKFLTAIFGDHLKIIEGCEYTYYLKDLFGGIDMFCCHGGLTAGMRMGDILPLSLVWGDSAWEKSTIPQKERLICVYGHWHYIRPTIGPKRIGLALGEGVALLSCEDHLIVSSEGDEIEVTREQLKI